MEITTKTEKYLVSIDGEKVEKGNCCLFKAKGLCCIGIFKGFGKRGAIEFDSILDNGNSFSLMPSGISNLVILHWVEDYLKELNK